MASQEKALRAFARACAIVMAFTLCAVHAYAQQVVQCFDAFKRFAPAGSAPEGMGLGLYSVKQATHTLGLQTKLQSVPGKGTSLWVSLATAKTNERAC